MNDPVIDIGDLVKDNDDVGYCYEMRGLSVFIKWFNVDGSIQAEQYWLLGEIEDFVSNGTWQIIRKNNGKSI